MLTKNSGKNITISNILKRSIELADVSDSPRLDIELILGYVLGKNRTYLYTYPDKFLNDSQYISFNRLLEHRLNGKPIAYIIGSREFWSLPLKVSPATIIPRPETELLVETVLSLLLGEKISVLDLGTGTGAIALALASEKPLWNITAVDSELGALELAQENRKNFGFSNVSIYQSNWFASLKEYSFDLIVSNPPYVSLDDENLQRGDVRFEPLSALVAENSGLSDIHTITFGAYSHLNWGGWLMLEHGCDQGESVRKFMLKAGYCQIKTFSDLSGLDRVSICRKLN
tara:strand:- start:281 stop:1141 length:861 start_codon:yes stop_codon:yes gene_type:complete